MLTFLLLLMDRQEVYQARSLGLFIFPLMLGYMLYRYDSCHTFLCRCSCIINAFINLLIAKSAAETSSLKAFQLVPCFIACGSQDDS